MKIMSFNTQHSYSFLEKKINIELMAKVIREINPDIVGLQETYGKGDAPEFNEQVKVLSELTGIENYYFAEAIKIKGVNPYGNGLLSKYPIKSAEVISIPDAVPRKDGKGYETRCVLKATLENDVLVLVCHFGLNPEEAENAVKTVIKHLRDEKCILMGDFNLEPNSPLLEPIRAKMKDTADLFKTPLLSFPSDKPTCKIDYVFVSSDIEVLQADIPEIIASDHRPHIAVVKV